MVIAPWLVKYGAVALKYTLIVGSITAIIASVYWYVDHTQERLVGLSAELEQSQSELRQIRGQLARTLSQIEEVRQREQQLQKAMREAEESRNELIRIFRDHNLTVLIREQPDLAEARINDATRDLLEDLRIISRDD